MRILSLKKLVLSVGADSRGICAPPCALGYPHHVLVRGLCKLGIFHISESEISEETSSEE